MKEKSGAVKHIIILTVLGGASAALTFLLKKYTTDTFVICSLIGVFLLYLTEILFIAKGSEIAYRLGITAYVTFLFVAGFLLIINLSGAAENFKSQEAMRTFIASMDGRAELIYVLIQFAQVVFLPIPAMITIIAGSLVFGAFKASVLSIIGILLGSFVAFFVGRIFGKKIAAWIVGEKPLKKYMDMMKGRDKIMLTAMFLLPFFPDDILCIIAGLTTMSFLYFFTVILITRTSMVFMTAYLGSGELIPYHGWGLVVWAVIILVVSLLLVILWKNSERLQKWLDKKFKKKRRA